MDRHGQATTAHQRPVFALCLTIGLAAVFATGVGDRPDGVAWDRTYDVVLYNLPYLAAAAACFSAAGRVRAERIAWLGLGVALTLSAIGNALRVLAAGVDGTGASSTLADLFALAGYLTIYVHVIGLIRVRVPRFHSSMWLDGIVGAFGTLAAGVGFLLGPYLYPGPGQRAVEAIELVGPVTSVLLLATLAAVGSILGVRLDSTLLTVTLGLCCMCVADIVLFTLKVRDAYVDGGPLELAWLAGIVCAAVAASGARNRRAPVDRNGGSRIGWRLLAVPLVCSLASLVVLGSGWTHPMPPVSAVLAVLCVLAGMARIAVTFHEVRSYNQVRQEARTDELTGLANRRALIERAPEIVAAANAGRPGALLLLDLDGFKEVNDSLGHAAGDELLRQVGPRLQRGMRGDDFLARLGGDEFAVLLPDTGAPQAQVLAERLRDLLLEPFTVAGTRLHVGVSVGVASTPMPATDVEDLLHRADLAMYMAKTARSGVQVYVPDPITGKPGGDRLRTMEELRTALAGGELAVYLQPQLDLRSGDVSGVEALIRWNHPTRGLLAPGEFLPAAEQAGLLRPLTDTVLELALKAASRWWEEYRVPVSVNLSAANVTDLDLPDKVVRALRRHGLPTQALTLELVEDTLMCDPERGRAVLADLRGVGVRTSIDDYGTGYSSLAYLRTLPADELKLDRSLTADVDRDPRAAAIVRHTVALAHDLGLSLVAEGVETLATSAALARLGCDVAQGYAIAHPMPVEAFLDWLAASHAALPDATLLPTLALGGVGDRGQ